MKTILTIITIVFVTLIMFGFLFLLYKGIELEQKEYQECTQNPVCLSERNKREENARIEQARADAEWERTRPEREMQARIEDERRKTRNRAFVGGYLFHKVTH